MCHYESTLITDHFNLHWVIFIWFGREFYFLFVDCFFVVYSDSFLSNNTCGKFETDNCSNLPSGKELSSNQVILTFNFKFEHLSMGICTQ